MKAFHITAQADGGCAAQPLPLPALHRKGEAPAEFFRQQASGEIPRADLNLAPTRFIRRIRLDDGPVRNLASGDGALLTFVISGRLTLAGALGEPLSIEPGDLFLMDSAVAGSLDASAEGRCLLIQSGVEGNWPGPEARILDDGTIVPRTSDGPNIKRVLKDVDERAYFADFPELFGAAPANMWADTRSLKGLRFMSWEDGFLDWHPEVINCLAIVLAGELELETRGRNGGIEVFRAGDVCMAEDRTGEGHIDRTRGVMQVALFVLEDDLRW